MIPLFRGLEGTAKLERGKFLRDITEELLLLTVLIPEGVRDTVFSKGSQQLIALARTLGSLPWSSHILLNFGISGGSRYGCNVYLKWAKMRLSHTL